MNHAQEDLFERRKNTRMKSFERKRMPLFELDAPGKYFEVESLGYGIYIICYPFIGRGSSRIRYPRVYSTYLPYDEPVRTYDFFKNLRFGTLYEEIII